MVIPGQEEILPVESGDTSHGDATITLQGDGRTPFSPSSAKIRQDRSVGTKGGVGSSSRRIARQGHVMDGGSGDQYRAMGLELHPGHMRITFEALLGQAV